MANAKALGHGRRVNGLREAEPGAGGVASYRGKTLWWGHEL